MKLNFIDVNEYFDDEKVITNHEYIDKNKVFTDDGLFSPIFFSKLEYDGNTYACSCRAMRGKFLEGLKCKKCNKKVEYVDVKLDNFAWIDLGNFELINPLFYNMLTKISSIAEITSMISYKKSLDSNGKEEEINDEEAEKFKYSSIGIFEFRNKFEEIINYYHSNTKSKTKDIIRDFLLSNKERVFINKIPVYTPSLRPALIIQGDVKADEINKLYSLIIKKSNILKDMNNEERSNIIVMPLQSSMQSIFNQVFETIKNALMSKSGFIRSHVLAHRLNFSSRMIISPIEAMENQNMSHIEMPYVAFAELYKFELINTISNVKNISIKDAETIWRLGQIKKNKFLLELAIDIVSKFDIRILLNRNPTISWGSILLLKVIKIKDNFSDLTLSINNKLLSSLSGDYDGDTLNIFSLKDKDLIDTFKIFDPENMVINRSTGDFNHIFNLDKDEIIALNNVMIQ